MDNNTDSDKEWEKTVEHTEIASQMHDIENKLATLVEKYGLVNEDSIPIAGLTIIMAAVTRLMALTITHEPKVSVMLMQDIVRAAHNSHEDTVEALRYAVDQLSGNDESKYKPMGSSLSLGDILGEALWSSNQEQ